MTIGGCVLGMSVLLCSCGDARLAESEQEKQQIAARMSQKQASDSAARTQCSSQAAAKMLAMGYSPERVSATTHYNAFLQKCFLRIDNVNSTGAQITTAIYLLDVSTNREIGEFFSSVAQGDSIDDAPALCSLVISDQEQSCTSPEQFTALARHYME